MNTTDTRWTEGSRFMVAIYGGRLEFHYPLGSVKAYDERERQASRLERQLEASIRRIDEAAQLDELERRARATEPLQGDWDEFVAAQLDANGGHAPGCEAACVDDCPIGLERRADANRRARAAQAAWDEAGRLNVGSGLDFRPAPGGGQPRPLDA